MHKTTPKYCLAQVTIKLHGVERSRRREHNISASWLLFLLFDRVIVVLWAVFDFCH